MEDIFLYWPMRFGGPAGDGMLPGQVVVIGQYIPIPQGDIQSSHQGFARQGLQKFGLLILEELTYLHSEPPTIANRPLFSDLNHFL
jgi:hypothetical protein